MVVAAMPARFKPISDDLLRRTAGPAVYGRGVAYQAERRVDLLALDGARALARVRGTKTYGVELRSNDGRPSGTCDCPAFDDAGFCKHLVAVALAVNEAARDGKAPTDRISAARQYLSTQRVDALVERLLRRAVQDPDLLEEIELDAADAGDDDAALTARYREAIDEACDTDGGIDWRGAGDFAAGIDQVLARLEALLASGRASTVLGLLDHLFDQADEVFEAVDDSDGEIGGAMARAGDLHLEACHKARPDPVALAQSLFERELTGCWNTFEDAAGTYQAVLGAEGLAEYHRLALDAWTRRSAESAWTLKFILDRFAQRDGDLDARIALRKDDLKHPAGYIEIARLLVEAERKVEALKWLEEALWCFEDRPEERLHTFAADLLVDTGRPDDAEALLWTAFGRWPSLGLYRRLQTVTADRDARMARALAVLRPRLKEVARTEPWRSPAVVILEVQMAEGLIDGAWETAEAHDIGEARLEALANASVASHPRRAAAAYERLIEARLKDGGAANYDRAMALIKRRATAGPETQASYLADLAARHKAKRTFIARLKTLR